MEKKKSFPGISPSAWEHPADSAALAAFSSLPLAGDMIRRIFGSTTERSLRFAALANAARVTETQFPALHAALRTAAERLDVSPLPELFVRLDPRPNAAVLGVERPFIVVASSALDVWDGEELVGILGHELGHVLSGHAVYKTLLALAIRASSGIAASLPLGAAALQAAVAALMEWDRKSELSADRAGLLALQDAPLAYRILMKSAGGPLAEQMDLNEFFRQARDYEAGEGILDSIYKLLDVLGESHPFPVVRVTALQEWERGEAYTRILAGEYPKRGEAGERNAERDFERARGAYSREFEGSADPLAQAAAKVMEGLGGMFGSPPGSGGGGEGEGRTGSRRDPLESIEDVIDGIFGKRP